MIYQPYQWGGYTKSEVDTLLNSKANSSHTHTKSQITDFPTKEIDTIEEQGNGYIRYSNGLQICWGSINWQSACSTVWGSLYETSGVSESYAKSFVDAPSVSASGNIGDSSAVVDSSVASNTTTPMFYLCRGTARNEVKVCTVRYIAIGMWK